MISMFNCDYVKEIARKQRMGHRGSIFTDAFNWNTNVSSHKKDKN